MTDPKNPQAISDTDLDIVQGAGTSVGNPNKKKMRDDGQPLVERRKGGGQPGGKHLVGDSQPSGI